MRAYLNTHNLNVYLKEKFFQKKKKKPLVILVSLLQCPTGQPSRQVSADNPEYGSMFCLQSAKEDCHPEFSCFMEMFHRYNDIYNVYIHLALTWSPPTLALWWSSTPQVPQSSPTCLFWHIMCLLSCLICRGVTKRLTQKTRRGMRLG